MDTTNGTPKTSQLTTARAVSLPEALAAFMEFHESSVELKEKGWRVATFHYSESDEKAVWEIVPPAGE